MTPIEEKLYTIYEAAEILGRNHVTVRRQVRVNGIGVKVGRDWLLTADDIEKLKAVPKPGRPPWKKPKTETIG